MFLSEVWLAANASLLARANKTSALKMALVESPFARPGIDYYYDDLGGLRHSWHHLPLVHCKPATRLHARGVFTGGLDTCLLDKLVFLSRSRGAPGVVYRSIGAAWLCFCHTIPYHSCFGSIGKLPGGTTG